MSSSFKIRELVSNHPEDDSVVLNDLIRSLIDMQVPLGKLEVYDYKESIKDALKIIIEHEKLVVLMKRRLREEVRPQVMKFHYENRGPKKVMHPNSLDNLKNSK